ncbi:hypothetical protein SAICODRAFT_27208 [Saitoella complicata NRRL Y-17804]|uniref:Uncharacterized protein n=1 Tax=Saitoella complicata (strain BCRC 22490 / CBS 7301 / JCM 7358 / NBRC 10748 / NRRL Y-17804) TaxID=698492 RepID=A0A0E9NFZ6_SAICN|nr:uncharacterized protein SAICODRAFT_27208 [Saitoella complicata NRRL Y-17804]ODQ50838.1 hypothetical protein SAICODRAFT_27208 [Saitoella complicata NRRL Y-17804]GAO48330.1 hypothetical protein G7K_2504-t1 [Saitoella complicata NRRL Y-17804]
MPFNCFLRAFGVKLHFKVNKKVKTSFSSRSSFLLPHLEVFDSVTSSTLTEDTTDQVKRKVVTEEVCEVRVSEETLCSETRSHSSLRVSWVEETKLPHQIQQHTRATTRRHKKKPPVVAASSMPKPTSCPRWDHFARRNTARAFQKSVAGLLTRSEEPLERVDYSDGRPLSHEYIIKYISPLSRWCSWMEPPNIDRIYEAIYRDRVRC